MARPRSPRTGDPELDSELGEILDRLDVTENRDVLYEILVSAVRLAGDDADRLDLKITSATLDSINPRDVPCRCIQPR